MKAIARQKLYEQHGEELGGSDLRQRQNAIARAWLDGFRSAAKKIAVCPYNDEQLIYAWGAGRKEAQEREAIREQ